MLSTVEAVAKPVHDEVLKLQDSGDLEADLRRLARRLLRRVMQPRILQLRRLVIGEAGRFPELLRARPRTHDRRARTPECAPS
ncbi:MAG: hypothetical protein E6G10_15890 [Actinobacteria bacterium]|nr:MAG: hypothetical protein E6G10_15890 [Actinomycetota bacterium]